MKSSLFLSSCFHCLIMKIVLFTFVLLSCNHCYCYGESTAETTMTRAENTVKDQKEIPTKTTPLFRRRASVNVGSDAKTSAANGAGFIIVGGLLAEKNRCLHHCNMLKDANARFGRSAPSLKHACGCATIAPNAALAVAHRPASIDNQGRNQFDWKQLPFFLQFCDCIALL